MTLNALRLSAVSSRSVAVVFLVDGAKFHLPDPVAWRLLRGAETIRQGISHETVLALHDLEPSTGYRLVSEEGPACEFETEPCAGLVTLTDSGAEQTNPDNSAAFTRAVSLVPKGGTLRVPAGRWRTGPVFLKSNMTLLLDDGAELFAIGERDDWPQLEARNEDGHVLGSWEGLPECCYAGVVTAIGARNLAIIGAGTIDGGGDRGDWWSWPKETRGGARRPRTLHLIGCENTVLLGVNICNSPSWTVHPYDCKGLVASALRISNPADSPNTDGFNPESCEDVRMEGIRFSVGDDCIAIKAGKRGDDDNSHLVLTRDVVIRYCRMERGHGGVVLGSEMSGGIHDITIEDCEMSETDRGLRIKTRRGRGGAVSGVTFRRIDMDRVQTALTANAFYFCDADGHDAWVQDRSAAPVDDTTPHIFDIRVQDVTIRRLAIAVGAFLGLPEAPITGIYLKNISVSFDPSAEPAVPLMADYVRPMRHMTLVAEHAEVISEGPGGEPGMSVHEGVSL
ncbi:glycoside hydrolase family 28 protein [Roseibium algae]|uniref:Glycoside hydrolase family 28 protein n=1 Tax=Roseibium algae TaxID=3123038 RepID=A0ABU8TK70_9HYPH